MGTYRLSIVVERDEDGYVARCVDLQGCYAQGDTYEEAIENVEDAIRLHLEERIARGQPLPITTGVSLTTVEVTV